MKKKFVSLVLLIFLTYVNMPFYFVGITAIHKLAYYMFALLPFFVALYRGVKKDFNCVAFVMHFYFYFICAFCVLLITASFDIQYMIYFIRIIVGIFAGLSIFYIFNYVKKKFRLTISFSKLFLNSVLFYIWGTIFFIAIPPLKHFWTSILADLGKTDFSNVIEYVTRFGFAGFSGFGCAFMVCVATVVCCYLFLNKEMSLAQMKHNSILLLMGSFFYGRIGVVVTFISLGLLSLYLFFNRCPKLLSFYIRLLILMIVTFIGIYFVFPGTNAFIEWLFEPIFNFFENGTVSSQSTNGLKSFYKNFHPSNHTLLFGDGYWLALDGNGYYGHTDVGFMRNIYYGGVFYTILLYSVALLFLYTFYVLLKGLGKKGALFILFMMFLQLFLFEVKGDIAFFFIKFYLPLFVSLLYEEKESVHIKTLNNGGIL